MIKQTEQVDPRIRFAHHFAVGGEADGSNLEGRTSIEVPWREIQQNFKAFNDFSLRSSNMHHSSFLENALKISINNVKPQKELFGMHATTSVHIPGPPTPSLEIYGNRGAPRPIIGDPGLEIRESGTSRFNPFARAQHIDMDAQKVGNCTVASSEAAIYAALYGAALQAERSLAKEKDSELPLKLSEDKAKEVEKIYNDFIAYNRYVELKKYIEDREIEGKNFEGLTSGDKRLLFNAYKCFKENKELSPAIYEAGLEVLEQNIDKKYSQYFKSNFEKSEADRPKELQDNNSSSNLFTTILKWLLVILTLGLAYPFVFGPKGISNNGSDKNDILMQGKTESHIENANEILQKSVNTYQQEYEKKPGERQQLKVAELRDIHARLKATPTADTFDQDKTIITSIPQQPSLIIQNDPKLASRTENLQDQKEEVTSTIPRSKL